MSDGGSAVDGGLTRELEAWDNPLARPLPPWPLSALCPEALRPSSPPPPEPQPGIDHSWAQRGDRGALTSSPSPGFSPHGTLERSRHVHSPWSPCCWWASFPDHSLWPFRKRDCEPGSAVGDSLLTSKPGRLCRAAEQYTQPLMMSRDTHPLQVGWVCLVSSRLGLGCTGQPPQQRALHPEGQ